MAEQSGQGHLFEGWQELNQEQQAELLADLQGVDFEYVSHVFRASTLAAGPASLAKVQPVHDVAALAATSNAQRQAWSAAGLKLIAQGKLGVLLLAGGQGTRLGSAAPKGCYDIGLPSRKSLFQLQAERLVRLQKLAAEAECSPGAAVGKPLQWYIMTSETTDAATREHFDAHAFFGLQREQVVFFKQGWLPALSPEGRIILSTRSSLFKAPDGNGGVYTALAASGVLAHMKAAGVEAVDCYCVDNALVKLGDPLFAGYCHTSGAQCGARVVCKACPEEKVGVFARGEDGALQVVEYSEMDPADAASIDPNTGMLRFKWSNVCMHYFTVDFLSAMASQLQEAGVYHVASKKIPSKDGPVQGIKLELFIFDTFPLAQRAALMEVVRGEEFAPVKNAAGSASDSPDTARDAILRLHTSWVEAAGGRVKAPGGIEVSPLVSYGGEGLAALCDGMAFEDAFVPSLQGQMSQ